ncbi:MAG TPA: N-acetyltransferase [Candidatus Limnocylindrales bacterium]|nr:N-acetyltransferase [Candidatus Limnocylindrales bacterium]
MRHTERPTGVRRARPDDARAIHGLIGRYAGQQLLLPRPIEDVYARLRDFWVATEGGEIVGCVALRIWWHDLAEVRSLAVSTTAGGRGHGGRLVEAVAGEAQRYGIRVLFALTRIEPWFTAHGFTTVERAVLYDKVWGDCARCPFRQACDEVAVVRALVPGALEPFVHPDPARLARVAHVVPPRAPGQPERMLPLVAPTAEPRAR